MSSMAVSVGKCIYTIKVRSEILFSLSKCQELFGKRKMNISEPVWPIFMFRIIFAGENTLIL